MIEAFVPAPSRLPRSWRTWKAPRSPRPRSVTARAIEAKRKLSSFQLPVVPGYDSLLNRMVTIVGVNDDRGTRSGENALHSALQLETGEHDGLVNTAETGRHAR